MLSGNEPSITWTTDDKDLQRHMVYFATRVKKFYHHHVQQQYIFAYFFHKGGK